MTFLESFQNLLPEADKVTIAYCGICEAEVEGIYIKPPEGNYFECIHGHKTRKWGADVHC